MGVISITQRRESLGNIGGTHAAHGVTNTNIGTVQHQRPGIYTAHMARPAMTTGDSIRAAGRAIGEVAAAIGAVQEREDEEQVDRITRAVMSSLERQDRDDREVTDWKAPGREHLEGQQRGLLLRTGNGCRGLGDEADETFGKTFAVVVDGVDATDRQKEIAARRLEGYRLGRQTRMMDRERSELRKAELDGAIGTLNEYELAWRGGNQGALEAVFRQADKVAGLQGHTPEMRRASSQQLAARLARDLAVNRLRGCQSKEDFDAFDESVKDGVEKVLPGEIASRLNGGKVGEDAKKALLEESRRARHVFDARMEAEARQRREAVRSQFGLDVAGLYDPKSGVAEEEIPERYAQICEKAAQAALEAGDPTAAANYRQDAKSTRASWAKAQAQAQTRGSRAASPADELDANDTELRYAEGALALSVAEGRESPGRLAERQMRLYRTATRLFSERRLKPDDFAAFQRRMEQLSDADTARASAEFYRAFGFTYDADGDGLISASERKRAEKKGGKLYFPGTQGTDDEVRVSMKEFLQFHDAFMSELRAMPPEERRPSAVQELLGRFRQGWYRKVFDGDIARSVADEMSEIRSGLRSRYEASEADRKAALEAARKAEELRSMPLVDMRHPANAVPGDGAQDPLDFYGTWVMGAQTR